MASRWVDVAYQIRSRSDAFPLREVTLPLPGGSPLASLAPYRRMAACLTPSTPVS